MTKVAFWYDRPQEYSGGLNYVRNLLHAIAASGDRRIEPFVFFGTRVDDALVDPFRPLATVVRTKVLDRKSIPWFLHKVLFKSIGSLLMIKRELRRHGISIVSHAENVYGRRAPLRVISWIPDFQYLHLPQLFPGLDADAETDRLRKIIRETDAVVLSSHAALEDFRRVAPPGTESKARVLQFVSQPNSRLLESAARGSLDAVRAKYELPGERFFFLPNQFWSHKNHAVVFEAVRQLKERGVDVVVVCTGNLRDYRLAGTQYADELRDFVRTHGLDAHIKILGLIDYDDVLLLLRNCLALLNPSRFEGWSSTVEEAKSIGKRVVLSNIPVHVEQAPPGARYFEPDDAHELAEILGELWRTGPGDDEAHREADALARLHERTIAYGRAYADIVRRVEDGQR
jgi:glycosyltransferase involved in cell wall biosynthesis